MNTTWHSYRVSAILCALLCAILLIAGCTNGEGNTPTQATSTESPNQSDTIDTPDTTSSDDEPASGDNDSTPEDDSQDDATTSELQPVSREGQPVVIRGEFAYTNDIIAEYYEQHAVALVDMYGFLLRDEEWEIPVESQTLGYLDMDEETMQASYWLQLPALPAATFADVDQNGQEDTGVQIFAVAYWPNLTGGPYSVGDDRSMGWPSFLTSVVTDRENQDEVIGGKLVIWAPDDAQQFPTDFGDDGLLFTEDDPVAPIQAGYTIVDLDEQPFAMIQETEPSITLNEPQDFAVKDFADLSYTEAFDEMFDRVSTEYAFNDIEGKAPDWDVVYDEVMPMVEEAEENNDPQGFYLAMREFVSAFADGHVNLSGGPSSNFFIERVGGGYGLALRELDDGRVIVVFVLEDGPADQAGIEVGAEVSEFNDELIADAIGNVEPLEGPYSTDFAYRYDQVRYLMRAPIGTDVRITFTNPGQSSSETVTLSGEPEFESLFATSVFGDFRPDALPVEYRLLDSGAGYIKINSNFDDLALIITLFERALRIFEEGQVPGIIIDMRQNGGGAPLGLAGFLTNEEIIIGQSEYYSEGTGQFEPEGPPDRVFPNENQYRFDTVVLLVGAGCFSACEEEAYGFSQLPDVVILGHTPTAGVFAEVARGQYELPADISLQVPTGRIILPDGGVFLEGTGVEPTQRIPVTEESVLSDEDLVLQAAEEVILE